MKKMPVVIGLGELKDRKTGLTVKANDKRHATLIGNRYMPDYLKTAGFKTAVAQTETYYRINYGK